MNKVVSKTRSSPDRHRKKSDKRHSSPGRKESQSVESSHHKSSKTKTKAEEENYRNTSKSESKSRPETSSSKPNLNGTNAKTSISDLSFESKQQQTRSNSNKDKEENRQAKSVKPDFEPLKNGDDDKEKRISKSKSHKEQIGSKKAKKKKKSKSPSEKKSDRRRSPSASERKRRRTRSRSHSRSRSRSRGRKQSRRHHRSSRSRSRSRRRDGQESRLPFTQTLNLSEKFLQIANLSEMFGGNSCLEHIKVNAASSRVTRPLSAGDAVMKSSNKSVSDFIELCKNLSNQGDNSASSDYASGLARCHETQSTALVNTFAFCCCCFTHLEFLSFMPIFFSYLHI